MTIKGIGERFERVFNVIDRFIRYDNRVAGEDPFLVLQALMTYSEIHARAAETAGHFPLEIINQIRENARINAIRFEESDPPKFQILGIE